MYSLILPGFLLACVCGMFYILKWRRGKYLRHLPTLPYLPIVGNMHYLVGGGKSLFQLLVHISNIMEETNLPFVFWAGIHPVIAIENLSDAKRIFTEFIEKPYFYGFSKEWTGNGLVTAPGYIWKKNIKKLAGTFTREIVNGYQDTFNTQARNLVKELKFQADCAPVNSMKLLTYATLESICQTALGVPEISKSIVTEEYYQAFTKTLKCLVDRGVNILLHPQCIYKRTKAYKQYMEHVAVLNKVSETVLKKRKQEQLEVRKKQSSDYDNSRPKSKAFLNILLEMSESDDSLTEERIKSELNTIIFAGQETIATTLFFTLLVIGSRKDIQDKLYKEMKEIFGHSKRDVLQEDLERMIFCEGVIHETLRLYPPVPVVLREIEYDFKLQSCTLPKGSKCALNVWAAGRSRRVWGEDVLEYRPERWSQPTSSILAFSVGRRACIGKKYAMAFLKTTLAHLIRELMFTSDIDKVEFKVDITLNICEGDLMQVQQRGGEYVV